MRLLIFKDMKCTLVDHCIINRILQELSFNIRFVLYKFRECF